jgi:thiamine transport system substrate-binding protein
MVSFSSDTAYEAMFGEQLRYKAYAPEKEGYRTVFGIGVVKETEHEQLAKAFINLLLSEEIQELLPSTEIMFPANSKAQLPQEFDEYAVIPETQLLLPLDVVAEKMDEWLHDWETVITEP